MPQNTELTDFKVVGCHPSWKLDRFQAVDFGVATHSDMYDIYAPMVADASKTIPFEEDKATMYDALPPWGEEYRAIIGRDRTTAGATCMRTWVSVPGLYERRCGTPLPPFPAPAFALVDVALAVCVLLCHDCMTWSFPPHLNFLEIQMGRKGNGNRAGMIGLEIQKHPNGAMSFGCR